MRGERSGVSPRERNHATRKGDRETGGDRRCGTGVFDVWDYEAARPARFPARNCHGNRIRVAVSAEGNRKKARERFVCCPNHRPNELALQSPGTTASMIAISSLQHNHSANIRSTAAHILDNGWMYGVRISKQAKALLRATVLRVDSFGE